MSSLNLRFAMFGAIAVFGVEGCKSDGLPDASSGSIGMGGSSSTSSSSSSSGSSSSSSSSASSSSSSGGVVAPRCAPNATWGTGTAVAGISTSAAHFLASITPDELTIAWMDSSTGAGAVYIADRASPSAAFGTPQTIPGPFAPARAALSADGLTLIVVLSGNTGFTQFTRASRAVAFSTTPHPEPFAIMFGGDPESPTPPPVPNVSDPVLSPDGLFLYFTQTFPVDPSGATVLEAYRSSLPAQFPTPRALVDNALKPVSGKLRRPTGVSSDVRALFYWDETDNQTRVAYRDGVYDPPQNVFTIFTALGDRRNVSPATDCLKLYYTNGTTSQITVAPKL